MVFAFKVLALGALFSSGLVVGYSKAPVPSNVELIYPQEATIPLNSDTTFGWVFTNDAQAGVYFTGSIDLILPSGKVASISQDSNSNPNEIGFTDCSKTILTSATNYLISDAGGGEGNYIAMWNFTYAFPSTVDVTNGKIVCTGLGLSETFLLQRNISVVANAAQSSSYPTQSASATFSATPTGVAYNPTASASSAEGNNPLRQGWTLVLAFMMSLCAALIQAC